MLKKAYPSRTWLVLSVVLLWGTGLNCCCFAPSCCSQPLPVDSESVSCCQSSEADSRGDKPTCGLASGRCLCEKTALPSIPEGKICSVLPCAPLDFEPDDFHVETDVSSPSFLSTIYSSPPPRAPPCPTFVS